MFVNRFFEGMRKLTVDKSAFLRYFVVLFYKKPTSSRTWFFLEVFMRKLLFVWMSTLLYVLMCCMGLSACKGEKPDDVVITVENALENQTLLSYMQEMQEDGTITFAMKNGMVAGLNGTSNTTKSFWMLYTTDAENANRAWGTYTYNGETLGSAILGAENLVVKNGETYVWVYQTF